MKQTTKPIELTPYVDNTNLKISLKRDNSFIKIDAASISNKIYELSVAGALDLDTFVGAISGNNNFNLNRVKAKNINTSGSLSIPWELKLISKDDLKFTTLMKFDGLSITSDEFSIEGLNGSINVSEDLAISENGVKFKSLKGRDPFLRVDYSQLEPYLIDDDVLSSQTTIIDHRAWTIYRKCRSGAKSIKRFILHMKMFDGMQMGKMYFNFNNEDLKFGLLSRVSGLNMGALSNKEKDRHRVGMRTAIEFDMRKSLMEGQIDIVEIGKEQLFDILDFLDPDHINEKFGRYERPYRYHIRNMSVFV